MVLRGTRVTRIPRERTVVEMSEPVAAVPKLDVLAVPRQIDRLLTTVRDTHHRAILQNYLRHVLLPGHVLAAQGFPVPDPADTYRFTVLLAMIWPYDENAKLIGEHVYVDLSSIQIEQADPADIVTPERAAELVTPLLEASCGCQKVGRGC
jgi:hypothetical protein